MILKFDEMEEKILPEFKGGAGAMKAKMYNDENGKILLGRLEKGSTIGYHLHDTSSEMIYIISGTAQYNLDNETTEIVSAGQCHYCPKGHSHSMQCAGDETVVFFAVVPEQ